MLKLRENGLNIDYMYETNSVLRKTAETEISDLTFWPRFSSVRVFINRNRTEIRFPHIPTENPKYRGAQPLWDGVVADPLKESLSSTSNLVVLRQRLCAYDYKGTPKIGSAEAPLPLRWGRGCSIKACPLPTRVTTSNLVVLQQRSVRINRRES